MRTSQPASEVGAAVASARLRLHRFYGGCKGTTLFRPLVAVVGSVLPSGAGVSGDATVGDQLPEVTGRTLGCGSRGPPEALFSAAHGVSLVQLATSPGDRLSGCSFAFAAVGACWSGVRAPGLVQAELPGR